METWKLIVDKNVDELQGYPQLEKAAKFLQENEVVAFPTETVYGLGANAKSDEAVAKIFKAKGRPSDNPLIVHIAHASQLDDFVISIPEKAKILMDAFWPGPLTILFQWKEGSLSKLVTAGLKTVAVRMPDHPVALNLLKQTNLPIAAPSANRSGKPSPTLASHVWEDMNGYISGVVDGGATGVGLESTVIDCTVDIPMILRPGGITQEQIAALIGEVTVDQSLVDEEVAPKSPGMKYTHYAPDAPLYLVEGSKEKLQSVIDESRQKGLKVGVLTTSENEHFYGADYIYACGTRANLDSVAQSLYDALRYFNHTEAQIIFSETFEHAGVGKAIMNRLLKAAGHKII